MSTKELENEDVVVGMTEEEAHAIGSKHGFAVRAVNRDGVQFILSADFKPNRRNIVLKQGVVTEVTRG